MAVHNQDGNTISANLTLTWRNRLTFQNIQEILSISSLVITSFYLIYLIFHDHGFPVLYVLTSAMTIMLVASMGTIITISYRTENKNSPKIGYDFSMIMLILLSSGVLAFNEMSKIDPQFGLISIFYSVLIVLELMNILVSFNSTP